MQKIHEKIMRAAARYALRATLSAARADKDCMKRNSKRMEAVRHEN